MGTIGIIDGQEVDLDALLEEYEQRQPSFTQPATAQTPKPPKEEPSFFNLVVAHAKDNSLRFYLQKVLDVFDPAEPNFTVTENDVAGYEDFPQLMMAKSRAELIQMKGIADDIKLQRRVMAESSPLSNVGAGLVAGLADPINLATGFVGGGITNAGFKIFGVGKRLVGWGGAAVKGAAGAAVAAPLDVAVRSSLDQREADVKEYAIGATASGLFGGLISAAPTIWRNIKGAERERATEALADLANRYSLPEPIPFNDYKPQSAFGLEKFSLGSPDLKLANSRFKTARDFGFNATPFSFNIVDKAGKPIAQNATVEMSTLNAVSTDLYQFQKGVQKCFKQYLDESTQYNWCSKTFKNWSAFNFYRGKAYDEFSKEFMHAMLHPDEIPTKAIASTVEMFRNASEELTQKAMKAGVFNENFEALKTTWERERGALTRQRDAYEKAVTDTQNIIKFNEETADAVTHSVYKLNEQIDAFHDKKLRVKDLLAENAKPLSEARKTYRDTKASSERAEVSGIRKFGEMEGLGKANRAVDKNKTPIEAKASGLEQMAFDENVVLSEEKAELTFLHKLRPQLTELNQQLRERIGEVRNVIYEGLNDVIAQLSSDTILVNESPKKLNSQLYHLERARVGKMTARGARVTSKEIQDANEEIHKLMKQVAENVKTKKEVPAHIIEQMKEIEDQVAYVDFLKTELKKTEDVLKPLERIDKAITEKVSNANVRLHEIVTKHEEKRAEANAAADRIERREHIKNTLKSLNAHYDERITDLKADIKELSKTLTELNQTRGRLDATMTRLGKNKLTAEQTERLTYLDKRLADPKFTIADISNIKDPIYFPRIYRKDLLASKKGNARYRMQRALAEGYRAEGSEKPIEELLQSASDSIDKIIGNKKSKHLNARKQRGSELQREIDIPTQYLEDFIVHDPMMLYENLARTFEPDIYLMKAFGTLNKEKILAKLKEERDAMAQTAVSNKELRKLDKDWSEAHDTISLVWDRLRGERSAEAEWGAKFLSGVKSYKISSSLGQLSLTTLYNLSTIQQHVGLGIFLKNFIKIRTAKLIYGNEANADLWVRAFNATDYNRLTDLAEGLGYRGVDALARGLVKATFAQEIDEQCRLVLGYTILEKVAKACTKVANGKKLSRASVRQLRRIGISKEMELRIADEFSKHGEILKGGIYKANFENWDEDVAEAFISAIRQVQYEGVVTPTVGSTPAIFDKAWGSTWLLFKRAMATAYPKVTIPLLQDARKGKLIKVGSVLFTHAGVSYLKELGSDFVTGRERTDDERIEKALSSMDALSWGSYVYDLYKSLQKTEENPFFGGSKFLPDALGATSSFLTDIPVAAGGIYRGLTGEDIQRIQAQSMRRLLPFNNLIWWSWLANMGIDGYFPPKKKNQMYSSPFGF